MIQILMMTLIMFKKPEFSSPKHTVGKNQLYKLPLISYTHSHIHNMQISNKHKEKIRKHEFD